MTHEGVLRSWLFTPANRPSAFEKALATGADCVCLDLEDAVPPDAKADARPEALAFWAGPVGESVKRALRINPVSSVAGVRDLEALLELGPGAGILMLPKVNEAAELRLVAALLDEIGSEVQLAALIETAQGLSDVERIARADPRVRYLMFGGVDLSAEFSASPGSETMRIARARIVHAAHAAGCAVLDVPELAFRDAQKVRTAAEMARDNGFTGKAAIHPSNVKSINEVFTPSADEIAQARAIVAAYDASETGLVVINGKLIEAPVIKGMLRKLAIAKAAGVL